MKTHVSMGGILYRVGQLVSQEQTYGAVFLGYGRHVNPKGDYTNADTVSLYRTSTGYLAR